MDEEEERSFSSSPDSNYSCIGIRNCAHADDLSDLIVVPDVGNIKNRPLEDLFDEDDVKSISYGDDVCALCNGFCAPNFGDPICGICHTFLFRPSLDHSGDLSKVAEVSDNDSGNDEPPMDNSDRPNIVNQVCDPNQLPTAEVIEINVKIDDVVLQINRISRLLPHCDININTFPTEILMHIFKYLDDISLWTVGQVNDRWREIMHLHVPASRWLTFLRERWPLFRIPSEAQNFFEIYSALMNSCCCFKCVREMADKKQLSGNESSWRSHRLDTEIRCMRFDTLEGIAAKPLDREWCHWQATIEGPKGSPYEGGLFFLYIQIPYAYPMDPPVVRFLTKILHPNISRHGDIGIDSIHHNWSLALTISKVLISIQSLLTDPYCDVCMEPTVGSLYRNNRQVFEEQARVWTWRYAMHDAANY